MPLFAFAMNSYRHVISLRVIVIVIAQDIINIRFQKIFLF
jgi:hypothetical protein